MEMCKNKASGKYFLFIEETDDENLLLVIPTGEVKELESQLFEEIEELDIGYYLNENLITSRQNDGYKKFIEKNSVGIFLNAIKSEEDPLEQLQLARENMSIMQWEYVFEFFYNAIKDNDAN